jgi:hypothetical protein
VDVNANALVSNNPVKSAAPNLPNAVRLLASRVAILDCWTAVDGES